MKKDGKLSFDVVAWIAVSERGYPAPFIGYAFERKTLRLRYEHMFGHTAESAGYRFVKARLVKA